MKDFCGYTDFGHELLHAMFDTAYVSFLWLPSGFLGETVYQIKTVRLRAFLQETYGVSQKQMIPKLLCPALINGSILPLHRHAALLEENKDISPG